MTRSARLVALLTLLVLAAGGVTIAIVDTDGDGRPDTITVPLGPPQLERPDLPDTLTIDRDALQAAAKTDAGDHQGARDEVPDGVPLDELRAGQAQQDRLAADDRLPIVTPLAAPSQRGCRSSFVRNYSSRRGVRPRLFVVHYTVSSNRSGWSDVNAIVGLFNQASFAASSNYVIDDEAHCAYIVRESDKAWTQAGFNPVSISVEMIATGKEGRLTSAAGYRRLGQVISDATKRWGIPLQTAKVSGCTVVRPGVIDHRSLGTCGGNHSDISPYRLSDVLKAAKTARKTGTAPTGRASLTKGERTNVDELEYRRRVARRNGGWAKVSPMHNRKATTAKNWLKHRLKVIATGTHANRPARRATIQAVIAAS